VNLPGGESEIWEEVRDFADSDGEDTNGEQPKLYTIDPLTGTVQFGPLIREPSQLKRLTQERTQLQPRERFVRRENGRVDNRFTALPPGDADDEILERQYGKVPPSGAEIYMVAYRTGGGTRGNVQAEKLTVLKTAIPYVKNVVNYKAAEGGTDAESLEQAVIRVPKELRTRECAVMPEDFENVAKKAHRAVARAHCLSDNSTPGIVRLLIVPRKVDIGTFDFRRGMHPDQYFSLGSLKEEIQEYMKDRKPLGVQVKLEEPEYVGVSVKAEVILEPNYTRDRDQEEIKEKIRSELLVALYRFLNPLTGGIDGKGWPLGRPVYRSDIFALCQNLKIPGVRYYLGMVKLFELRKYGSEWVRTEFPESDTAVDPSSLGLICSWADESPELESGHVIEFIDY
jgi:predicted phage baseplate assembly protein